MYPCFPKKYHDAKRAGCSGIHQLVFLSRLRVLAKILEELITKAPINYVANSMQESVASLKAVLKTINSKIALYGYIDYFIVLYNLLFRCVSALSTIHHPRKGM